MCTERRIFNLVQKAWKAFKFQLWVIEKSYNCALVHYSCKSTVETLTAMWQTLCQNYSRQELSQYSLAVVATASVRAGCMDWLLGSFRVRDRKYLSVGFVFRISEATLMFFVACKDSSRLRFSSKYSTSWWIFRKNRIVAISWRWFSRPRRPKKRPK